MVPTDCLFVCFGVVLVSFVLWSVWLSKSGLLGVILTNSGYERPIPVPRSGLRKYLVFWNLRDFLTYLAKVNRDPDLFDLG